MKVDWHNKHILLTGASSGIGLELTRTAIAAGAKLSVLVRKRVAELDELEGEQLHIFLGDVSKVELVNDWMAAATDCFGQFNVMVNNAGAMYYMHSLEAKLDQMQAMVETNCMGYVNLIHSALPHLVKAAQPHWINISSDAGRQAFPGLAVYSGTKSFVEFVTHAMRQELSQENIKFTNIQPGNVATQLHAKSTEAVALEKFATENNGQYLTTSDIVSAISYALSTPHHVAVNEVLVEPLSESI
jgi:NADP-dependent 3-hydroxy acid dehydrogenase YdfG